jgi:hypothetical protein
MPKPGRKVWRLRGIGRNYLVVRRWDLDPDEDFIEKPYFISSVLDRALNDPVQAPRFLDMLSAVGGHWPRDPSGHSGYALSRLQDAFRTGRLVLLEPVVERGGSGGSGAGGPSASSASSAPRGAAPAPAPPGPRPAPTKTWIEFQLLDNDDKPIPNERYKVKLTDGSTKDGHLDSSGTVRFAGIDPGSCDISFPDLDAKDWADA